MEEEKFTMEPQYEIIRALASFDGVRHNLEEQMSVLKYRVFTNDVSGSGLKERIETYFGDPNWSKMSFTLIVKDYVGVNGQMTLLQMQLDDLYSKTFDKLKKQAILVSKQIERAKNKIETMEKSIEGLSGTENTTKSYVKQMENRLKNDGKDVEGLLIEHAYKTNLLMMKKGDVTQHISNETLTAELNTNKIISKKTVYFYVLEKARLSIPINITELRDYGVSHQRISDIIREFMRRKYIVMIEERKDGRVFKLSQVESPEQPNSEMREGMA